MRSEIRRAAIVAGIIGAFFGLIQLHRRYDAPHPKPVVEEKPYDASWAFETWITHGHRAVLDLTFRGDTGSPAQWSAFSDPLLPSADPAWLRDLDRLRKAPPKDAAARSFAEPMGLIFHDGAAILVRGTGEKKVTLTLSEAAVKDTADRVFDVTGERRMTFPESAKLVRGRAYRLKGECEGGPAIETEFRVASEADEEIEKTTARLFARHLPKPDVRRFVQAVSLTARGFWNAAWNTLSGRAPAEGVEVGVLELKLFLAARLGRTAEAREAAAELDRPN